MTDDTRADNPIVVMTTLATRGHAIRLVRSLVEQRLVACGTVFEQVTSVYRWEEETREDSETMVLLKTTAMRWHDLRRAIETEHPYDVPEVLALPADWGAEPYMSWIRSETSEDTK